MPHTLIYTQSKSKNVIMPEFMKENARSKKMERACKMLKISRAIVKRGKREPGMNSSSSESESNVKDNGSESSTENESPLCTPKLEFYLFNVEEVDNRENGSIDFEFTFVFEKQQ
jgi:hypothetical protein